MAGEVSTAQGSSTPVSVAAPDSSSAGSSDKGGREVEVRWYDARARTALKKVAVWTNVPWTKIAIFECLAAQEAQVLDAQPALHILTSSVCLVCYSSACMKADAPALAALQSPHSQVLGVLYCLKVVEH